MASSISTGGSTIIPIDYTSKDFQSFRDSMLTYATGAFPGWTSRSPNDFGVMMVELFAYMGDILSYYGDRVEAEAYIGTATQRASILKLATLLGYTPNGNIAATGVVAFATEAAQTAGVVVPKGTKVSTDYISAFDAPLFFETDYDITVPAAGGTQTVSVTQGETQGVQTFLLHPGTPDQETVAVEALGISDGIIDQEFSLAATPIIEGSVRVFVDNSDPTSTEALLEYKYIDYLIDAKSSDAAFAKHADERGVVTILFGDGINGTIPPVGLRVFAGYRIGGGTQGNVGVNSVTDIASAVTGVNLTGSTTMTGGADAESNDQIRANAPRAYQTQNRAVTLEDYGNLALGVTAVNKASAVANSFTSVTIYVVGPQGTVPQQALISAVQQYVDARKMTGTTVTVLPASLVPVNIGTPGAPVTVGVLARYNRGAVSVAITQALQSLLSSDNTDFGKRIPLSAIYSAIMRVPGVEYAAVPLLARSDASQTGTADIITRAWEIPTAGSLNISVTGGTG